MANAFDMYTKYMKSKKEKSVAKTLYEANNNSAEKQSNYYKNYQKAARELEQAQKKYDSMLDTYKHTTNVQGPVQPGRDIILSNGESATDSVKRQSDELYAQKQKIDQLTKRVRANAVKSFGKQDYKEVDSALRQGANSFSDAQKSVSQVAASFDPYKAQEQRRSVHVSQQTAAKQAEEDAMTSADVQKQIDETRSKQAAHDDNYVRWAALDMERNSSVDGLSEADETEYQKLTAGGYGTRNQTYAREIERLESLKTKKVAQESAKKIADPIVANPNYKRLSVFRGEQATDKNTDEATYIYNFLNLERDEKKSELEHYKDDPRYSDAEAMEDAADEAIGRNLQAFISDDERAVYNALYNSNQKEQAMAYIDALKPLLQDRRSAAENSYMSEYATQHPVKASLDSIVLKPGGDILATGDNIVRTVTNQPLDTNSPYQSVSKAVETVRGTVSKNINNGVLSELYNIGMSIGDSALAIGGFGGAGGYIMASGAYASTVRSAKERGATDAEANSLGILAGVAEAVFERFSIDRLLSPKAGSGIKHFIIETLKQSGVEASEELATELTNVLTDQMVMGDLSNYNLSVEKYMQDDGLSREEAERKARMDLAGQVTEAALGGFVSGGVMGGAVNAAQGVAYKSAQNDIKHAMRYEGSRDVDFNRALAVVRGEFGGDVVDTVDSKTLESAYDEGKLDRARKNVDYIIEHPYEQGIIDIATDVNMNRQAFEERTGVEVTGTGAERIETVKKAINAEREGKAFTDEEFDRLVSEKSTGVTFRPMSEYTPQQRATIKGFINSANSRIVDLVQKVKSGDYVDNDKVFFDPVDTKTAQKIQKLVGVYPDNYKSAIEARQINHIIKRHGENGIQDHTMSNDLDIARIEYVMKNYDNIEYGGTSTSYTTIKPNGQPKQADTVLYSKQIDGTMYVVQAVPNTKAKTVNVVSAYTSKKGTSQLSDTTSSDAPTATSETASVIVPSSVDASLRLSDATQKSSPTETSKTSSALNASSNPTVPQDTDGVKGSIRKNMPENTDTQESRAADIQYSKKKSEWTAENKNDTSRNVKVKSLNRIVEEAKKAFNIPISSGRIRQRNALGIYKVKSEAVRTVTTNDLPTICHEIGHHLDKKYNIRKMPGIKEAILLLDPAFAAQYSSNQLPGEAVAEFMREYMRDKTHAKQTYPTLCSEFERSLSKHDKKVIDRIADDVNAYMYADMMERAKSSVVHRWDNDNVSVKDQFSATVDWAITNFQNEAYAIKKSFDSRTWQLYTSSLDSDSITRSAVENYLPDINGEKVYDSLSDIVKPIKHSDFNDFEVYLKMNHALEYSDNSLRTFADDLLQDRNTMQQTIKELEQKHPEFKEVANRIYGYNRALVETWLVKTGVLTQEAANAMFEKFPKYVPFYRKSNDFNGTRRSIANQKANIKRAKGGGQDTYSPLENMIVNTDKFIKAAKRNEVMKSIVNQCNNIDGMAYLLERIPPKMCPKTVSLDPVMDALREISEDGIDVSAITDYFSEIFENGITEFTTGAFQGKDVVIFKNNGQNEYYEVHDPSLLEALTSMNAMQRDVVVGLIGRFSRFWKTVVTGSNPFFIPNNFLRDIKAAWDNSGAANPLKFTKDMVGAMVQIAKKGDVYKRYLASGGGYNTSIANTKKICELMSDMMDTNPNVVRKFIKKMIHPVLLIENISEVVEAAPRLAEYNRVYQKTGDTIEAMYAADNITVNFKLKGKARAVNAVVPFANAQIQGLARYFDEIKKHPARFLVKQGIGAVLMVLIQRAFASANDDEEEYEKLSSYMKNNYYNFSMGNGRFVRIPKSHEHAVLDSTFERAVDAVCGDMDKKDWKDFADYVLEQFLPPAVVVPGIQTENLDVGEWIQETFADTIFGGGVEAAANKDYRGNSIVPGNMENLPPAEQYDENSTAIAKWIGRTIGMSPKKIDHLLDSYTGVIGKVNKALTADKKDYSLGLKTQFVSDAAYSNDVLDRFYQDFNKANQKYNSSEVSGEDKVNYLRYYDMKMGITQMNKYAYIKGITPTRQRDIKIMIRDIVDDFSESTPPTYENELAALLERTGETISITYLRPDIKINDREKHLIFEQYVDYVEEYHNRLDEEYARILNTDYTDDVKLKLLDEARRNVKKQVDVQYYRMAQ